MRCRAHVRSLLVCLLLVAGCSGPASSVDEGAALEQDLTSEYTATRYPIVLIPGFLGFDKLVGTVEYFPGVAAELEESGARVFQVKVSQAASSDVRGAEIIPQLEQLRRITGATKFNLIGHSQGAMDARFIAGTRPDLVASVTSVGGPHRGTPVADAVLGMGDLGTAGASLLADFFTLLAGAPNRNDAKASLLSLSTGGARDFAARFPAGLPKAECGEGEPRVNGIRYWSWGGVGWLTNPLDLLDPLWVLLGAMGKEPNDGLVGRCSNHLGEVIRDDYPQNHIDQTNMVFGLVGILGPNPKTLYRIHANRMRKEGL